MTLTAPSIGAGAVALDRAENPRGARLGRVSGLGLGTAVIWMSLLVLIPLAAVVFKAFGGGWHDFWHAITRHQAIQSLELTVGASLVVALINAVMGTLLAWVLVRDEFVGKRYVEMIIDIPFALPTIVAGLVMLAVYGTHSPIGVNLYGTRRGVVFALLFVTLPFVVRAVEPVLHAIDREAELAAACLGAGPLTVFRRVVLPLLLPAIASGAGLAFARAMGEYGTVLLLGGGQDQAEVSSQYTYGLLESYDYVGAAATATVLLFISLLVIVGLDLLQRRTARRG
jgi:sulfate transport system permease protein